MKKILYKNEIGNDEVVYIPSRIRKGICEACGRTVDSGELKSTRIHHILYDDENPIRFTIELCARCHSQYHRLTGDVGINFRDEINKIVELKWGPLGEGKEKPKIRQARIGERYRTGEKALTRKEYETVLAVCGSLEDRVMVMLAVSLGLRRGDLVRVRVGNVDFKNHQLTYLEKKKGDRVRVVPIGQKLEQEIKMLIGTIPKEQDTLFSFKDRQAYNRFNSLCEKAGIGSRPFHALRATCIKFCQAGGWSPEQVSELTGDTIEVIQAHYATPSQAEMSEVMRNKEVC